MSAKIEQKLHGKHWWPSNTFYVTVSKKGFLNRKYERVPELGFIQKQTLHLTRARSGVSMDEGDECFISFRQEHEFSPTGT